MTRSTRPLFEGDVMVRFEQLDLIGPARNQPTGHARYGIRALGPVKGQELVIFDGRETSDPTSGLALVSVRERIVGADLRAPFLQLEDPKFRRAPQLLLSEMRLPLDSRSGYYTRENRPYWSFTSVAGDGGQPTEIVIVAITDNAHRMVFETYGPLYEERHAGDHFIVVANSVEVVSEAAFVVGDEP